MSISSSLNKRSVEMVNSNNKFGGGRDKRDNPRDKDRRGQFKIDHRHSASDNGPKNTEKHPAKPKEEKQEHADQSNKSSKIKESKFEPVKGRSSRERSDRRDKHEEASQEMEDIREQKKFTGRCRLFVGNVPPETSESDFASWFKPYGECSEIFLNAQRGFGFIRMDTRENAEIAKRAVDGLEKKGRFLRVRFAAHSAAIRVKHLHPYVSNELLMEAFGMFGEIERAVVCIDEKGKSTGEGLIEFARKPGAMAALKRVNDGVFLLGSSPRPVVCELLEHKDEEDGMPEVFMNKNQDFQKERDAPPRFAAPGSFEFNFAQKWKELYAQHEEKKKMLDLQFQDAVNKLELDEANARMEHQTAMMREDLLRRQEELKRMEEQHKIEMQRLIQQSYGSSRRGSLNMQSDEQRRMMDMQRGMDLRHHQEEAKRQLDEERRREEEARMFMQQEMAMRQMQQEERRGRQGDNAAPMQPPPAPPLGGGNNQRGGRNDVPSLMEMGHRMKANEQGRPNNMGQGMGNEMRGMQGGMNPQGMQPQQNMMTPPQMGGMRQRKGDSDYRQSRFDQPPQNFPGNQQQMGGNPQMMSGMGNTQISSPHVGNAQMHPLGQQMGMQPMGAGQMGNMGNQMMPMGGQVQGQNMGGMQGGNPGNMGGQNNQGRGKHMGDRQEGGRGDYYEAKRPRRY